MTTPLEDARGALTAYDCGDVVPYDLADALRRMLDECVVLDKADRDVRALGRGSRGVAVAIVAGQVADQL